MISTSNNSNSGDETLPTSVRSLLHLSRISAAPTHIWLDIELLVCNGIHEGLGFSYVKCLGEQSTQ